MTTPVDKPLHLQPRIVAKPWGGRRLGDWGRILPSEGNFGESWDVSDLGAEATSLPDPASVVAHGPHAGATLSRLIETQRADLLGASRPAAGRFPLLVKVLDAREHLSVQVHPGDDYVARHPGVFTKTESWVVLAADDGAGMWLGVREGVTIAQLQSALGTPAMVPLMRWVPATPGDVHHLPAGMVHALGAGVVVAEVQTPSDTTFRMYDWQSEYARAPRELHLDAGVEALALGWDHNRPPWGHVEHAPPTVVATDAYRIDRHACGEGEAWHSPGGRVRVLMVLDGMVGGDDLAWPLAPGGVVVLPAAWDGLLDAIEAATILEVVAA